MNLIAAKDVLEEYKVDIMLKRIITAIVSLCILAPILLFSDTVIFPAGFAIVALISLFELFRCMGVHKNIALTLPMYISAVAFPFLQRVFVNDMYVAIIAFIVAVTYVIYVFALTIWSHGKLTYNNACAVCLTSFYILISTNMIIYVRDFEQIGKYIFWLVFIGAWVTDTFAYFTGVLFGKHKLIEDVSPKKTIEGSVGGIFFCSLSFVIFGLVVDYVFNCNANLIFLAVSGIIISIISQIGDLIMSVVKRHYGIKDFGKLFPGHGGMLDRFDSVLSVTLGVAMVCMFSYITGIKLL